MAAKEAGTGGLNLADIPHHSQSNIYRHFCCCIWKSVHSIIKLGMG